MIAHARTGPRVKARSVAWAAAGAGLLASVLLAVNVTASLSRPFAQVLPDGYRYWEDFQAAVAVAVAPAPGALVERPVQRRVEDALARSGARPWQFWAVVPADAVTMAASARLRAFEDFGRAHLAALGFRMFGGAAPWLMAWMAPVLCLPLLVWTSVEMARGGWPVAGVAYAFAWSASAFVADALPLAYSAVGFYLVGVLTVVPWSAALLGRRSPGPRGLLLRAAGVAGVLAVCVYCRGGTLLLLPGFLLPLALAAWRRSVRPPAAALAALLLVALPAAARSGGGHDLWITLWEGLGDFDREKGHSWSDAAAKRFVRGAGVDDLRSVDAQPVFRRAVLGAIVGDPGWYAGILAGRLGASLSQWKILPRGAIRPATTPGEGAMDGYYGLTRTVDTFAAGASAIELPLPLLWLGPLALAVLALRREDARRGAQVTLCLLVATLGVPVVVSTAGALETQAVALSWFLAGAFVLETLVGTRLSRTRPQSPPLRDDAHHSGEHDRGAHDVEPAGVRLPGNGA
jgi:hypothetical protein